MNDIDKELPQILSSMILESINNLDFSIEDWEPRIKSLFKHGVCADCDFSKKCRTLREYFHGESLDNYCSDFQSKEPK